MGIRRTVVAALALLLPLQAWAGDPQEELAKTLAPRLAERGYAVDLGKIRIEVKDARSMAVDLGKQQRILLPPDHYAEFAHMMAALSKRRTGAPPDEKEVAGLEATIVDAMASIVPAYYQPGEGRLVFRKPEAGDVLAAISDPAHVVAHELVHAHQDQTRGFETMFKAARRTREGARLMSCLLEGEAEIVALSLSCDLLKVDDADLASDLERALVGEQMAVLYSAGRTYMAGRFREGGWPAVAAALDHPPPSTEQVLHPGKRGRDQPTTVSLPDVGIPVWIEDVVGELDIYRQLMVMGSDRGEAWFAASGWDGDLLRIHRDGKGGEVLLWRTLWDRPEDAEQFVKVMAERAGGTATRRGRLVDWRWASSENLAALADAALERTGKSPAIVEEDAASAAEEEKSYATRNASGPERRGEAWVLPAAGIRIPIPAGWEMQDVRGMKVLADPEGAMETGFGPNINCQVLPVPAGKDLDALLEDNRKQITSLPGWSLDFISKTTIEGLPALRYGFHAKLGNPGDEMVLRFLGVILLKGGRQIVVTATTTDSLWERQKDLLAKTLAGIRLEGAPPAGGK